MCSIMIVDLHKHPSKRRPSQEQTVWALQIPTKSRALIFQAAESFLKWNTAEEVPNTNSPQSVTYGNVFQTS